MKKIYYSKYNSYMIFKTRGGRKVDEFGSVQLLMPETVKFQNGMYISNDAEEQKLIEKHIGFGKDFWDGKTPVLKKKEENVSKPVTIQSKIKEKKDEEDKT